LVGQEVRQRVEPVHAVRIGGEQEVRLNPLEGESELQRMLPLGPEDVVIDLVSSEPVIAERGAVQAALKRCKVGDLNYRGVQARQGAESIIRAQGVGARSGL